MTLAEFVADVVGRLEAASIDYMIGGSVASSIYGEPRTTRDVDIVIDVSPESLASLFAGFDRARIYVDEPPSGQVVAAGRMYNLLDTHSGWKADLVVRKALPFSSVEFARRSRREVLGTAAMVASAEDVLLTKLEWSLASGSSRQIDDARGIVAVQGDRLDTEYLRRWAVELGVVELLDSVLRSNN
ncbi:MAG: hypothetical protein K8R99_02425 [Actinomycetia bacterium]|nr:hypothetical protein [Actinomycetes bacterium]